jgi:hypothetical protein
VKSIAKKCVKSIANEKFQESQLQAIIQTYLLTELEAKCIVLYTLESRVSFDRQFHYLFNRAYRQRNDETLKLFADFSFHFMSGLHKLPSVVLSPGAKLYRGTSRRLAEMNDLYTVGGEVCWHQTSLAYDESVWYELFGHQSGTQIVLIGVRDAKDIRLLSMNPYDNEFVILHNSRFKVQVALSCDLVNLFVRKRIDENIDLVILEQISS